MSAKARAKMLEVNPEFIRDGENHPSYIPAGKGYWEAKAAEEAGAVKAASR